MTNIKFKGKIKVVLKQKAYGKFGYKANIFNKIAKPYTAIKCFANADLGVWRVWGLSLKRCKMSLNHINGMDFWAYKLNKKSLLSLSK
jgi:hypothetical protein